MYYFDVLPIHPKLEHHESLSSYLTRLAMANGIRQEVGLADLLFQGKWNLVGQNPDYPPLIRDELLTASNLCEARLMRATFANLGKKFLRALTVRSLKQFLRNSVREYLCFCPVCVKYLGYYRLTWRFRAQFGCCDHQVALEEKCYRCHSRIPLISPPYEIGVCPKCGTHFAEAVPIELTSEESMRCYVLDRELRYLLDPQWWDNHAIVMLYYVSRYIQFWREAKGLSRSQIALMIGCQAEAITGIERYNYRWCGDTLETYIDYLKFLEHGIADPFRQVEHDIQSYELDWNVRNGVTITKTAQKLGLSAGGLKAQTVSKQDKRVYKALDLVDLV